MMVMVLFLVAVAAFGQPADLVLRNGKVVTMEPSLPVAEAVAIRGGRILAVGSEAEVGRTVGPGTRIIDIRGMLAVPGFIEGHGHFTGLGVFQMSLNLRNAKSWEEVVTAVRRATAAAKPGDWIIGRGWHQAKWSGPPAPNVDGFPVHAELSRASPRNPVWLTHASGHAGFANAEAMRVAGVTRATADPPGGAILRDAAGNLTGLFQERAQGLISRAYTAWQSKRSAREREADLARAVELATEECLSNGITTFQDAGSPFATVDALKKMADAGRLRLRLWVMLRAPHDELERRIGGYRIDGAGGGRLTVRAIKRQMDGALGPRGAWLLEPYSDLPPGAPNTRGFATEDPADLRKTAELAIAHDFQLCVHAIGDRANRETLDLFEQVFRAHPGKRDLRWRIEHAQHLGAADIPRFSKLGVIASMQGIHCTSDAPFVIPRLGARRAAEGAYAWRKLLDTGTIVTNGTDAPVEDVSPVASFHASISRKLTDGSVFYGDQRMSREEALRSYTWSNAYAAFEEHEKGSLKAGKLADITVLSQDIMTLPEERIPATRVVYTIVGGTIAYQNRAVVP
jgi:predicted amidohydrolase YtcJ